MRLCLRHFYPTILSLTLLVVCLFTPPARADWVQGVFSERAGIDSIERFIVLRDTVDMTLFGWAIVPVGDIVGDSADDILVAKPGSSCELGDPSFLFEGGIGLDTYLEQSFDSMDQSFTRRFGDFNNDGFQDLGVFQCPSLMRVFYGGPLLDDEPDFEIPVHYSTIADLVDIDSDGALEWPVSRNVNGGYVDIYRVGASPDTVPEYAIPDTSRGFGSVVATGDYNGDGVYDIAVSASVNRDTSFVKLYWGGIDFDTVPDLIITSGIEDFGRSMLSIGDFNGDGCGDLAIFGSGNEAGGVFLGGRPMDTTLDIVVNKSRRHTGYFLPSSLDCAGDLNNDGYPDFILGCESEEDFHVYLGGPTDDTIRLSDVYLRSEFIPGVQGELGYTVAGVGDFNGDGINDIAVSSRTATGGIGWWGEVNFFAGYDTLATDIQPDPAALPSDFTLRQNYPNPFNPTTTIKFDLPRRTDVTVTVYNLLGQQVALLHEGTLSAGPHQVTWDGTNDKKMPVASGVYLYKLHHDNGTLSKKMMLVR